MSRMAGSSTRAAECGVVPARTVTVRAVQQAQAVGTKGEQRDLEHSGTEVEPNGPVGEAIERTQDALYAPCTLIEQAPGRILEDLF